MTEILFGILFWGILTGFPLFAFYRGICHGKARQSQKRSDRVVPAIKHTILWSSIGAIFFAMTDSDAPGSMSQFVFWLHSAKIFGESFLFFVIICGIPFTIGMLLIPGGNVD